jgi:hypothetical protein
MCKENLFKRKIIMMNLKITQMISLCFMIICIANSSIYGKESIPDLKLSVVLPKKILYIGEPLIIHTRLDNLSNRDLMVPSIGGMASNALSYTIEQISKSGETQEILVVNSENEMAAYGWDVRIGTRLVNLPPGESLTWKKDAFEVLNIKRPGRYFLQALYKTTEGVIILSAKVEFYLEEYNFSDNKGFESIIDELNSPELSKDTVSIIPAIYTYENSEIISRLIELASDKVLDGDTRFYAIVALGKVKAIKAIPFLQKIVEDEEELDYFRNAACRSISKIQKSYKK